MATSRFQNLRAALKTVLVARLTTDGVTGVDVFEYEPRGDVVREDMIWFGRITVDQEPLTMGGTGHGISETLNVDFHIRAPRNGADQETASEAEQRAEQILSVVENALRHAPSVSSTVMSAEVDSFESIPDYDEAGAIGTIEGTITCLANL